MGKRWSSVDVRYISSHYKTLGNTEMGKIIGRTGAAVKRKLYDLGLQRDDDMLHRIRSRICARSNAGHFKVGSVPHNALYDGYERITKDGYIEVRLCSGVFKLKHIVMWEKVNGPLKKGYCLRCVDGDKLNTDPSNWRLITRIENMYRNSKYAPPEDVIPSLVLIKQLDNKINSLENGSK